METFYGLTTMKQGEADPSVGKLDDKDEDDKEYDKEEENIEGEGIDKKDDGTTTTKLEEQDE